MLKMFKFINFFIYFKKILKLNILNWNCRKICEIVQMKPKQEKNHMIIVWFSKQVFRTSKKLTYRLSHKIKSIGQINEHEKSVNQWWMGVKINL